jgi:hypothetical protein
MTPEPEVRAGQDPEKREAKKSYATPELTVHGTVEEITKNIGTKGTDAVIGSRML